MLDARNKNNTKAKKYIFSYELYKLYLKNIEFYKASIELTNYFIGSEYSSIIAESENLISSSTSLPIRNQKSILSNNINKVNRAYNHNNKNNYRIKSSKFEKKYLEVETGFVKLFDNLSDDVKLKSQIIKDVLNHKDNLENSLEYVYSKLVVENKSDSLKVLYDNLNKDFDKLLFSLYYKEKSYKKAFEYIPNENNLDNQTFNKISIFANQLFNEKEYSLAYSYYSKILDNTDELSNNDMKNRSIIRIFDNYIDAMLSLEKNDEAITFLNKLILGLDSKEQKYLHKDDLYLQLAEIYQYGIFDIEKAEETYLEKFNLHKKQMITRSKSRYKSSPSHLKASVNYYELLLMEGIKSDEEKELSKYILKNNLINRAITEKERFSYISTFSSILIENDYNLFFKKSDIYIRANLNSDFSNDLLNIQYALKPLISFNKDGKVKKISNNTKELIDSYIKFKLNNKFVVTNININDFLKIGKNDREIDKKVFIVNFKYEYLKARNSIEGLDTFISNLLKEEFIITKGSDVRANYFDKIFLDFVKIKVNNRSGVHHNQELKREVLTFFLNNYSSSVLYNEARKMLREI